MLYISGGFLFSVERRSIPLQTKIKRGRYCDIIGCLLVAHSFFPNVHTASGMRLVLGSA